MTAAELRQQLDDLGYVLLPQVMDAAATDQAPR